MKKTVVVLLTLLVAIACIGLPLWLALAESKRQAFQGEGDRALGYARDVVIRADETARQVRSGLERLVARHAGAPCSPASLDLMRQIDLASSYLQAVGHVRGNRMVCSSIAGRSQALELGPPALLGTAGALLRPDVRFPSVPDVSFGVIQVGEFAAIIHQATVIDTAKGEPDVSLSLLSLRSPVPLAARGHIDGRWLARLGNAPEAVFLEDGHVIALVRSPQNLTVGVAAVPLSYLEARSDALATELVPAGVLAGVVLTLAILVLARQQLALPAAVKTALRRRELFLEYQPVVELHSGRWIGVEALVRWRRPTGEIVMPELFIPIAEQNGLIDKLTRQVLELVCRDTGFYLEIHPDFHIGINVAPSDFHSPGFLDSLQHTLQRMGARPSSIILEVTERGLLDPVVARETSGALRRHGFAIAIDDFGTGYSSLSYLETLELDYLKIDRSFIEAIGTGAPTSQVVGHIIRMAKDLGLKMIAEGVESQAQAEFLLERGVQYAQGWLYGRSMPFAEIVRRMEDMVQQESDALQVSG
ncbi:EAL domain-containing protein [Massilia sp. BSC265]|uniref:EAL domain-containing protein n=1 Tax=Massilia sp. BSC265 TaxID=1549812 RepID=UPI0009DF90A0|nr:EAL domain-containing protein [Massilia sp. BSC265]